MSSTFAPHNFALKPLGMGTACLRRGREFAVWGGLILALGTGGIGVKVTWAQSPEESRPESSAAGASPDSAISAPAAIVPEASRGAVLEAERTDTIEAERPPSPPDLRTAEPSLASPVPAMVPSRPSPVPQPSRERVVLGTDLRTPGQRSTESLRAQAEVKAAPFWARDDAGVTFADGTLVLRSRRFSSPAEACQELTSLAVTWLRHKFESETGRAIADPVKVLRQEAELELVLQSYVQDIALNEQKVLETPMYIGHLRLPVTDTLRERVYADWRAQLVTQRLFELLGGAALLSGVFVVIGRYLRSVPESQ